jgi:hypothetical protein
MKEHMMQNEAPTNPAGDRMDTQENLFIRIIKALDALGLQVVAIKDGRSLVIKAVDKEPPPLIDKSEPVD